MDGFDDFSAYNGDTMHDMWVDDMYSTGNVSNYIILDDEEQPITDQSDTHTQASRYIDDCGNIDVDSLLDDCLHDVGYYND